MKILHTADLHLRNEQDIPALRAVLRTAQNEGAGLVLIAGDLFDASADGRSLEAALLPLWQEYKGDVLIVPGNHDIKYLKNRRELAENVTVASAEPFSLCKVENTVFLCVPYQANKSLKDIALPRHEADALVTHGTFGSDAEGRYFPISPADIAGKYRYAALGHYHTWFDKYIEGCLAVNPGAPRQTRRSDRGARYVSLVDSNSWLTERIELPVSFTEYKTLAVSVLDSHAEIAERIAASAAFLSQHALAQLHLTIKGSLVYSELSLAKRIQLWADILGEKGIDIHRISWDLKNVTQITGDILYSSFTRSMIDKLAAESPEELSELAPYLLERLQETTKTTD